MEVCPVKQVQCIVAISPFLPHQLAFTDESSSGRRVSIRWRGYALWASVLWSATFPPQ
jgi:hypothetical protein